MKKTVVGFASVMLSVLSFGAWYDGPVLKAKVDLGAYGHDEASHRSDPHYISLSESGTYLMVNLNSWAVEGKIPVKAFDVATLLAADGEASDSAIKSWDAVKNLAWKGGAISEKWGVAVVGSGSDGSTTHSVLSLSDGTTGTVDLGRKSDGLAFDAVGNLYGNDSVSGSRNLVVRYAFTALAASGGTFTEKTFPTSLGRIRNVSVYTIGGRTLVFAGEGDSTAGTKGKVIAVDVTDAEWTEYAVVTTALANDIMNVKVSGISAGAPVLHVMTEAGEYAAYQLAADGRSATATALKTLSAADFNALFGTTVASGGFRSLEVTDDGSRAFLTVGQRYTELERTFLYVLRGPAAVVDITKAVRDAGKGSVPKLVIGTAHNTTGVVNAFGESLATANRVFIKEANNAVTWTIAEDFEAGKPIVVTSYTLRRTSYDAGNETENGNSRARAPKHLYLEASFDYDSTSATLNNGTWVALDEQKDLTWGVDEMEKTFPIDSSACGDYRKYRLRVVDTARSGSSSPQCGYQYVKLMGTIGEPLQETECLDYLVADGTAASELTDVTANLDVKVELDLALADDTAQHGIFAFGQSTDANRIRLFHTAEQGWRLDYKGTWGSSNVKATPGRRYKVVVDGPVVTVDGVEVANCGAKQTGAASNPMTLFGTLTDSKFYNFAKVKVWSVKVYDGSGVLRHEFKPVLYRDGGVRLRDQVTGNLYASSTVADRLTADYQAYAGMKDLLKDVENPTIALKEGTLHSGFPVENAFAYEQTQAKRALFDAVRNVIQYDIPDEFNVGAPYVVARYAVLPAVDNGTDSAAPGRTLTRFPTQFELQASKTGTDGSWVTLHKVESGVGPAVIKVGSGYGKIPGSNDYGYNGLSFEIPEGKRGDYRHYRFITSASGSSDTIKVAFQQLKLYGCNDGFDAVYVEPVEYVTENESGTTYFKTGVTPTACDLTVEMTGEFTDVSKTACLFSSRKAWNDRTWSLFLYNGALRLDCGNSSGQASSFKPELNKVYAIKVAQNVLSVDGTQIYTSGSPKDLVPGSELCLLADPTGANGAHFKLKSCRISRGDVVLRDYVAAQCSDGTAGLLDRQNLSDPARLLLSPNQPAVAGDPLDSSIQCRDRAVALTTKLEKGKLPDSPLEFALSGNQRLAAKLYAAMDNAWKGNSPDDWAELVELGDVETGNGTLKIDELPNSGNYRRVKFFVRDDLGDWTSQTQTYKLGGFGMMLIFR